MTQNCSLEEIGKRLLSVNKILLLCHARPDGDTLGSAFALKDALEHEGKDVRVFSYDKVQSRLLFLTDGAELLCPEQSFVPDIICSCDVAGLDMLKAAKDIYGTKIDIAIDHHGTNPRFGRELNYIDDTAAACCEIIYDLIDKCFAFSKKSLDCLYTGIASDTGCFQYTNTTPKTHRIAADLIERGCDFKMINHALFEAKTRSEIVCNKLALENLSFYLDDKVAMIAFTLDDKQKYGITDDDISAYAALPREIDGVICGISIRQFEENKFKVSLRSGVEADVSTTATFFGGGGHHSAAGCNVEADNISKAKETVINKITEKFKEQGLI